MAWSIYRKMFLFATVMIVLPVAALGFLSYRQSEGMLVNRIKQESHLTMENAASYFVKQYIGEIETTLNILTNDPELTDVSTLRRNQLLDRWEQYRRHTEAIWAISYCTSEGVLFVVPAGTSREGHESRGHALYQQAVDGLGIVWSGPYVDGKTHNAVVKAAKAVYRDGQFQGVVTVDASLYALSDIIGNIDMGSGGNLLLLDTDGNIIAHNELAMLGTNVRDTQWFKKLVQSGNNSVSFDSGNSKTYVSAVVLPQTGWMLVGFLPEETFSSEAVPIKITTFTVTLFGIILAALSSAVIAKGFVSRIQNLVANMGKIEKGEYKITASDHSTDEIGQLNRKFLDLAQRISSLMEQRDLNEQEISRQKAYFAQLFENSPESVAIVGELGKVTTINKQFANFFQYAPGEIVGVCLEDVLVPEYLIEESRRIAERIRGKGVVQAETVRRRKDGSLVDVELISYAIFFDDRPVGTYVIYRDISHRKAAERQLEFLTYHDALTGVYNRAYFENQCERLVIESNSVGVVVCDVDGLKLVNDSFGHARGDDLLKTATTLIRAVVPGDAVVARIGGDEFSLLLPDANETMVQELTAVLRRKIEEFNELSPDCPVSISIGYAMAGEGSHIGDALHEADSRMYNEKLLRSKSTRSAIVRTLMHALRARDFITEGHAERMSVMIEKLAGSMGFPEYKIQDLKLFAQFHDIGKVGIPDNILFKPGPLNTKEREAMRRHSEVGYRIAIASPELHHIADWILKHHEWWNGGGYPIGLRGAEIPTECRILAICDAYDAMTSQRPNRKAMSSRKALEEIERCSGTMFDPDIVRIFVSMAKEADILSE